MKNITVLNGYCNIQFDKDKTSKEVIEHLQTVITVLEVTKGQGNSQVIVDTGLNTHIKKESNG